jgi:uncharacterized LabA/DUF88 family protein
MGSMNPTIAFSPQSYQKAMIFIDGTNLFYRLESAKLKVPRLTAMFHARHIGERQITRVYCYTVEQHLAKAKKVHGDSFLDGVRVVLGDGVERGDGNIKEKGVDALLVADMIYHAANKNCEYVLLVTVDMDFQYVLRRVEDFGCRTALLGVCCQAPGKLQQACDDYHEVDAKWLLENNIAILIEGV